MPETLNITKAQLVQALAAWDARNARGECYTPQESAALSPERRNELSAEWMWEDLKSYGA